MKRPVDFRIEIKHFYCLDYFEGDRRMIVDVDFRDPVKYIDKRYITHWESPYDHEVLSSAEKERILNNIYNELVRRFGLENIERRCV